MCIESDEPICIRKRSTLRNECKQQICERLLNKDKHKRANILPSFSFGTHPKYLNLEQIFWPFINPKDG